MVIKKDFRVLTRVNYLANKFSYITLILIIIFSLSALPSLLQAVDKATEHSDIKIIPYGDLINKSVYTHANETITSVLDNITMSNSTKIDLLQPYFEPFSYLGNERLKSDDRDYSNIIDSYPPTSAQPAWVALFRAGQFQLFYSEKTIRIFVKGKSPEAGYNQHYSVIRHPINELLAKKELAISQLEVYSFRNNYLQQELELDSKPYIINTSNLTKSDENSYSLPSNKSPLDLRGLNNFFSFPMTLEAIEINSENKLYLYGQQLDYHRTIANKEISLSDFAVIYRAFFHYGYNPPFVSLDKNEDNRYAKVNYGGYLENTRVGEVVLEADKLFKTITTGFDQKSKKFISEELRYKVDNYLSEDERSFFNKSDSQRMSIRYWFYPDSVFTVSDEEMGLVKKCQFFADFERMDKFINKNISSEETIEHLNSNYPQYKSTFRTLRDLENVARLMALVNWLRVNKADERVDLDNLLSVELPAHSTPLINEKTLTLSAISYPKKEDMSIDYVTRNIKQFYLTDLLPDSLKLDSDQDFFDFALDYYSKLKSYDTIPKKYSGTYKANLGQSWVIKEQEKKIQKMNSEIDSLKQEPNYSYTKHNQLVKELNKLIQAYNYNVKTLSVSVDKINSLNLITSSIVSLSGGIDLSPDKFIIQYSDNDPKIKLYKNMTFTPHYDVSTYKGWVRNSYSTN